MMKSVAKILATCLLSVMGALPAHAGGILPAPQKVSEHVYAWVGPLEGPNKENQGFRMNMAFVVGADAVAVIDTGYTRAMGEEMIAHIARITKLPIRYAVNSNSQSHRHFGNDAFKAAGAEVMATPEEIARMEDMGGMFALFGAQALGLTEGAVVSPDLPGTAIEEARTLDLGGGVTVNLIPAGGNHTPNSLIAEVPSDKVVYAGDILYGERLLTIQDISDTGHWIKAFDNLRKFKGYTFIPGHGQPGPLSDFEFPTYSYLSKTWAFMMKALEDGVGLTEAIKAYDQSAYSKLANFESLVGRNASWAYQQAEMASF
ncbi:MAG: MBL fold metallo-hydrolase [Alphaproteobacteria bacterium]